jgi:hypothetical protein
MINIIILDWVARYVKIVGSNFIENLELNFIDSGLDFDGLSIILLLYAADMI